MDYKEQRWQQILSGKQSWGLNEDAAGNFTVFLNEYVLPLRALRDEGLIERVIQATDNRHGSQVIIRIDAIRPANR